MVLFGIKAQELPVDFCGFFILPGHLIQSAEVEKSGFHGLVSLQRFQIGFFGFPVISQLPGSFFPCSSGRSRGQDLPQEEGLSLLLASSYSFF
jgi:hypothetical protein